MDFTTRPCYTTPKTYECYDCKKSYRNANSLGGGAGNNSSVFANTQQQTKVAGTPISFWLE